MYTEIIGSHFAHWRSVYVAVVTGCRLPAGVFQYGCLIRHSDQFRGVQHSYTEAGSDPGDTVYAEPNPDYFRLLDLGDGGLTPVGYGHRSVEFIIENILKIEAAAGDDLDKRRELLSAVDAAGIVATPANSSYNELVIEACRLSIVNEGRAAKIIYGDDPHVELT